MSLFIYVYLVFSSVGKFLISSLCGWDYALAAHASPWFRAAQNFKTKEFFSRKFDMWSTWEWLGIPWYPQYWHGLLWPASKYMFPKSSILTAHPNVSILDGQTSLQKWLPFIVGWDPIFRVFYFCGPCQNQLLERDIFHFCSIFQIWTISNHLLVVLCCFGWNFKPSVNRFFIFWTFFLFWWMMCGIFFASQATLVSKKLEFLLGRNAMNAMEREGPKSWYFPYKMTVPTCLDILGVIEKGFATWECCKGLRTCIFQSHFLQFLRNLAFLHISST